MARGQVRGQPGAAERDGLAVTDHPVDADRFERADVVAIGGAAGIERLPVAGASGEPRAGHTLERGEAAGMVPMGVGGEKIADVLDAEA